MQAVVDHQQIPSGWSKDHRARFEKVSQDMLDLALDREIDHRDVVSPRDKCQSLVRTNRHAAFSQAGSRRLDQVVGSEIVGAQAAVRGRYQIGFLCHRRGLEQK